MKKKIINDLNDNRITNLCNSIFYYKKPEKDRAKTYIRWFFLDTEYTLFAGNKPMAKIFEIQIDIFSNKNYENLSKIIQTVLSEKNYNLYDEEDLEEETDKDNLIYHKVLRFKYLKFINQED